jgi:REP element-mobilizing transposase RayT
MVYAFHLTWTTYGYWFPNDPRGSWSEEVWEPRLLDVRELDDQRFVMTPRETPPEQLQEFMNAARATLRHPAVLLDPSEFDVAAQGFAEIVNKWNLWVLALAVLPHHVHILARRHWQTYERVVNALKGKSAQRVREGRGIPYAARRSERVPIWTIGYWVRYVPDEVVAEGVAAYIEENPVKHGLPPQKWAFVKGF